MQAISYLHITLDVLAEMTLSQICETGFQIRPNDGGTRVLLGERTCSPHQRSGRSSEDLQMCWRDCSPDCTLTSLSIQSSVSA